MSENNSYGTGSTTDLPGTEYDPAYVQSRAETEDSTASTRRNIFGLDTSPATYPTGTFYFGVDSAQEDFIIPMARFKFYSPFGDDILLADQQGAQSSPEIYIRMPGSFNSTLVNSYSPTQGIFGAPIQNLGVGNAGYDLVRLLEGITSSAAGSLQKQILDALTGGLGFIGSGGLNARGQIEFATRKAINNYNQVLYAGPVHRNFSLPFNMKPSNQTEAESMQAIIYCFRLASSPRAGDDTDLLNKALEDPELLATSGDIERIKLDAQAGKKLSAEDQQKLADYQSAISQITDNSSLELARATDVLTMGYPDMCKFQIVLMDAKDKKVLATLFKSDFCVINSVGVDYGSGNKMSFFKDYRPTEATLSLSLTEMVLTTAGSVTNQDNYIQ